MPLGSPVRGAVGASGGGGWGEAEGEFEGAGSALSKSRAGLCLQPHCIQPRVQGQRQGLPHSCAPKQYTYSTGS